MLTRFLTALTIWASLNAQAQEVNSKWGKISKDELALTKCPFDSTANAIVLSKTGVLAFNYHNDKGWQYELDVVKRIKVFNLDGKSEGNISINVYDPVSGTSKEALTNLKGYTYNLVNGKIEKTKLENDMMFETRLSDYRKETAFAMPNVQEGSVIEYRFSLRSDYVSNLYEWHFQEEIPVGYVRYQYTIPEFFTYNHSFVGNVREVETEDGKRDESFTYTYTHTESGQAPVQRKASINSLSKYQAVEAHNIEALSDEPMMNNKGGQIFRLESQLVGVAMPGSGYENVATTYDDFSKTLLSWSTFGSVLNKGGFAKDKIAALSNSTQREKLNALYSWIRDDITFNNVFGFSSNNANRRLINEGKGTAADINLTLISVLREAGFEAYPVILSTRGNGIPHPVYPSYEEFNYVIAAVFIDGQIVYADAASSLPIGVLPTYCLNGKGWMVRYEGSKWLDLKRGNRATYVVKSDIKMEDGVSSRNTEVRFDDYALYKERGKLVDSREQYAEDIANGFVNSEHSVQIDEENGLQLRISSTQNYEEDVIYLDPFDYGVITENPFKRNQRFSNVDFPYGTSIKAIANYEIPEGYSVELPESMAIALPENGGRFIYSVQKNGNRVTVLSQFKLVKTLFSAKDYPSLKQFYQLMADKNSEPLVLKRI